jgi:hypothetical protein
MCSDKTPSDSLNNNPLSTSQSTKEDDNTSDQGVIRSDIKVNPFNESMLKAFVERWPTEQAKRRHAAIAVAGFMINNSIDEEDVAKFVQQVASAASDPEASTYPGLVEIFSSSISMIDLGSSISQLDAIFGNGFVTEIAESLGIQDGLEIKIQYWINKFNDRHAIVRLGSKTYVLEKGYDPSLNRKTIDYCNPSDMKKFHGHWPWFPHPHTGRLINFVDFWMMRQEITRYDGVIFEPGKVNEVEGVLSYNLWEGHSVDPDPLGDCSLYLNHIKENIADGNEEVNQYLLAWLADAIQNPDDKPEVAIVLRGRQGTGKGVFVGEFGKLFGDHYIHLSDNRHLTRNFNKHLQNAMVVFADELRWTKNQQGLQNLKRNITERTLTIEPKGKDMFTVRNHIHLIIASNEQWVVPAGKEERRFMVLDVGDAHIQDHDYFKAIIDQMNQGGREALLDYLMKFPLDGVNLKKLPKTKALAQQKYMSFNPFERFWFDILESGINDPNSGQWALTITTKSLQEQYAAYRKGTSGTKKGSNTELGIAIQEAVPGITKSRTTINGKRELRYTLPKLDVCREAFLQDFDWKESV